MTYITLCVGIVALASLVIASNTEIAMKMVVGALSLILLSALTVWRHERPELL